MLNRILVVEDEAALRMTLGDRLRSEGYEIEFASDGDQAFEVATRLPFDLIILDVKLPGRDGLAVCRDVRRFGLRTPILMLTARAAVEDKVLGLRIGADDSVSKPFHMQELMARIEMLLRRAPGRTSGRSDNFRFGTVDVDLRGAETNRDGEPVDLTAREFQLLRFFIEHAGAAVSRDTLRREVWGFDSTRLSRSVDVHVASLRQKLENDPTKPEFFLTVQGVGYKFKP
jgi:two-component system alkaline phosphatase synthesis response regulator PhoP